MTASEPRSQRQYETLQPERACDPPEEVDEAVRFFIQLERDTMWRGFLLLLRQRHTQAMAMFLPAFLIQQLLKCT